MKLLVIDRIRTIFGLDRGIKSQLNREMSKFIKKDRSIKKAILMTKDGLPVYSYGIDKQDINNFSISLTTLITLIYKKSTSLGLVGKTSYIQMELDNGNIIIAISEMFSLTSFTDKNADTTIIKTLTQKALENFEKLFK